MNKEPISYKGEEYRDDRMYVINLTYAKITVRYNNPPRDSTVKYKWVLATYRNNLALTFFGSDQFESKEDAIKYLKDIEMQVPLISNDEQPLLIPDNIDKWTYWLEWLKKHQLFSAITEKQHMPFWADSRGFNNAKGYMQITEISDHKPLKLKREPFFFSKQITEISDHKPLMLKGEPFFFPGQK